MIIESIKLKNFRSYKEKEFFLSPTTNVFFGNNAEGKTNVLESVYVCALGKSFRTKKDAELVKFGEEFGVVDIVFYDKDRKKNINFIVSEKSKKQIKVNGIKQLKISDLLGNLYVVLFFPEDMNFVKGEPNERRKGFDLLISQLNPLYMHILQEYYKVLEQRNTLLKNKDRVINFDELDVWDEKLSDLNIKIKDIRNEYVEKIKPLFAKYHREIANQQEDVVIKYKTQVNGNREDVKKSLKDRRIQDLKRGFTSYGVHRDDYIFEINGLNLGLFGSQGQVRTAILSLKLAEKDLFYIEKDEMPILLLDDVMSELDGYRREYLYEKLKDCQVLITCTDKLNGSDITSFEIKKEN